MTISTMLPRNDSRSIGLVLAFALFVVSRTGVDALTTSIPPTAFSTDTSFATTIMRHRTVTISSRCQGLYSRNTPATTRLLASPKGGASDHQPPDDSEEDDGWGTTTSSSAMSTSSDKLQELKALQQQQRSNARGNEPNKSAVSNQQQQPQEEARDLFIPIFAIVSLAGLFGAYGYEMLRLYLRGELYLPF